MTRPSGSFFQGFRIYGTSVQPTRFVGPGLFPFRWQQERQWGKDTLKFYNADFLDALTRVLQKPSLMWGFVVHLQEW